jgi:hypothetical protein
MPQKRRLEEAHVICHQGLHVEDQHDGTFLTGFWVVRPEHIREGLVFALHETKATRSYLQGVVVRLTKVREGRSPSGRRQGRVQLLRSCVAAAAPRA